MNIMPKRSADPIRLGLGRLTTRYFRTVLVHALPWWRSGTVAGLAATSIPVLRRGPNEAAPEARIA